MNSFVLDIPVVLFVFRRLDTVKMILEKIREVKPKVFYVFSDGAREKNVDEQRQVRAVREYIQQNIDWDCQLHIEFSEKNKGCANNICSGMDKVFAKEWAAIILEDDVVPIKEFFAYCQYLLLKYKDNQKIHFIAGFNCIGDNDCIKESYTFSKTAGMSGAIATWSDRWNQCDFEMKSWPIRKKRRDFRKYYYSREMYHLTCKAFEDSYKNINEGWDYQFQFDQLDKGRFAIVPRGNLVKNSGFSEGALHKPGQEEAKRLMQIMDCTQKAFTFPMQEPEEIVLHKEYDKIRQKYYLAIKGNYFERHIYYCYRWGKDIIYRVMPRKVWNKLKQMVSK